MKLGYNYIKIKKIGLKYERLKIRIKMLEVDPKNWTVA